MNKVLQVIFTCIRPISLNYLNGRVIKPANSCVKGTEKYALYSDQACFKT